MKKVLILLGVLISICCQTYAAKTGVLMDMQKKGNGDKNTTVLRSPISLPSVEVYYDRETRMVEVICDCDVVGNVYLCDGSGNTLDCSSSINTVFTVPGDYEGELVLLIESECWTAIGTFVV